MPILAFEDLTRRFGGVTALDGVSAAIPDGRITCLLGGNGAGKSTLIKLLAGVFQPTRGRVLLDGAPTRLRSPRDARDRGIATVYQDLAVIPLMSVWRNFFLGAEPTLGRGPTRRIDVRRARSVAIRELDALGIELDDAEQPAGTLSGGERQAVALARALHFGARVLILDEPTAALGVKQTEVVLDTVTRVRDRGGTIIFITHDPRHAHAVGDRFLVLRRGRLVADRDRSDTSTDELARLMAGAAVGER